MEVKMNPQNYNFLVSSGRDELNALEFSMFAFKMELLINDECLSESQNELVEKISSSVNQLTLSLNEIRTLVSIYSQKNFNKVNPFVRNVVYYARSNDPKDICNLLVSK